MGSWETKFGVHATMLKQLFISVVLAAPVRLPDLADGSYGGVASANPRALAASTNPSALVVSGSNSSSTPSSGMRLRLDCSLGCQGGFKPTPTRFVAASDCMSDECRETSVECATASASMAGTVRDPVGDDECRAWMPVAPNHTLDAGAPGCEHQAGQSVRIAFVHMLKTAGTPVYLALNNAGVNYTHVHKHNWDVVSSVGFDVYIVSMRDPFNRTVSAFNYGHWVGGFNGGALEGESMNNTDESMNSADAERFYYECFGALPGGVNAFAEALSEETPCGQLARRALHDVGEWYFPFLYIGGGLSMFVHNTNLLLELRVRPHARVLLVNQESFESDLARMWTALCVRSPPHLSSSWTNTEDYPRRNDTQLSATGEANLRAALVVEYYLHGEMRRRGGWGG